MHFISTYLEEVQQVHSSSSGVKETSFYPALSKLFDTVGKKLKPPVYCVSILKNVGAGFPDGGFFTKSQNQTIEKEANNDKKKSLLESLKPERGVLEVKGVTQDLSELIKSNQVAKYLKEYGLVLVTNLREFALVDLKDNKPREIERFTICDDATRFWSLSPSKIAQDLGEEFEEFLTRCLLTGAPLKTPQDVAAFLASYARQARLRLETTELDVLDPLKAALEKALGIEFKAVDKPGKKLSEAQKREQGERFFRATLVQTLFYGLFSAWLSHVRESSESFRWREAQYSLHVPMVSTLFEELIKSSNLKSLELETLVTLAAEMLNRVDTGAFFEKWDAKDAVQYFYEPFLERFDATLRKELGVYYTPREIVQYMVTRVHQVLQSELGIEGGLANDEVMILDPCCGTGAFVLETLRVIGTELQKGPANRVAGRLKKAALDRVFGFEILPAPFVVAHHGVTDLLKMYGASLKEEERASIYLTNALTGWASEPNMPLDFAGFQKERELAQFVKQKKKILVILGNPPYDAFGTIDEDKDLIAPYKKNLYRDWGVSKNSLRDLYVRFFRVAERKLEDGNQGVLCFISNFSWTFEPSFVVMRKHLLSSFTSMWIDNLNGDSRETGKRTPELLPDPSVFSTPFNREGIKKGVSISLVVKSKKEGTKIAYRDFWGEQKRTDLLSSLEVADFDEQYEEAQPNNANWFRLRPRKMSTQYSSWPMVTEFSLEPGSLGLNENRKEGLISLDKESMAARMLDYFDPSKSIDDLQRSEHGLAFPAALFDPQKVRSKVLKEATFNEDDVLPFLARPFDLRFCYYTAINPVWNRSRPWLYEQIWEGNNLFVSRKTHSAKLEGAPFYFTSTIANQDALRGHAYYFPIRLRRKIQETEIDSSGQVRGKTRIANGKLEVVTRTEIIANLSSSARSYLESLGFASPDSDESVASALWLHVLAIGYSSLYREEHAGGLSNDWPRVPLPSSANALKDSAALGNYISVLLDMARPVVGIETGTFRHELEPFGLLTTENGAVIEDGDTTLELTENWGFFGERDIVQPGTPRVKERLPNQAEKDALTKLGLPLNTTMLDLPLHRDLNGHTQSYWSGVPLPVWNTFIGGYQVLKKWLSYRDQRVVGRAMHLEEAQEVENIVRRLTVLWSLADALNVNYSTCAANVWEWNTAELPVEGTKE